MVKISWWPWKLDQGHQNLILSLWRQSAVWRRLSVKSGLGHWQIMQTQIRCRRMRRLIWVCTVCIKLQEVKDSMKQSFVPVQGHFPSLHLATVNPPVLSVLWFILWLILLFQWVQQVAPKKIIQELLLVEWRAPSPVWVQSVWEPLLYDGELCINII